MIVIPKIGTLWYHTKTLKIYRVLGIAFMEVDETKVVIYQKAFPADPSERTVWVRPVKEWGGRFEYVKEAL